MAAILVGLIQYIESHQTQGESLKLNIQDNELDVVQKTKRLGVQIDNTLDLMEHVKTISSIVSRGIGFLKHAKSFVPLLETLKTMYTGIVEPHFHYFRSAWRCCGVTEINQLQKLQNRHIAVGGQTQAKAIGFNI